MYVIIGVFFFAFVITPIVSLCAIVGAVLFSLIKGIKDVLPQPRPYTPAPISRPVVRTAPPAPSALELEIQALRRLGKKPQL